MRTTKVLSIFIFGLIILLVRIGEADPIGTAFTYQGRLMDDNQPANGIYDLECKLFDSSDPCAAQVGPTLSFENGEVLDGYFTVHMDFGIGIFDGNERWLELGIRPGDSNDVYTPLSPRQEVTPTPYALYSANGGADNDWMVSGNDMYSTPSGNVGIGTTNPLYKLQVQKNSGITIYGYTRTGKAVFGASEGSGVGIYGVSDIESGYAGYFYGRSYFSGGVGVGTTNPVGQLTLGAYQGGTAGSAVAGHTKQLVLSGEYNTTYNTGSSVKLLISDYDNDTGTDIYPIYCEDEQNRVDFYVRKQEGSVSTAYFGGDVGIGTKTPAGKLDIRSTDSTCLFVNSESSNINAWFNVYHTSGGQAIMATSNSNLSPTVQISSTGSAGALSVEGTAKVDVLQIMGADVAEKFPVRRKDEIKPGMVVAIDPDHPGELCLSRTAYNQCVAGVISGANNLPAGAILGNLLDHEDGLPVALSGRVWVYCDAMEQPIEPGNLLTTAERPGYAMAVSNFEKAHGTVIGKAMTRLEKGKTDLVLVLVNLQ
ncbi:MAG: hypothetical protein ACYS30_19925 [Planctomycetota bacterium]|jgi:hypothetical protein